MEDEECLALVARDRSVARNVPRLVRGSGKGDDGAVARLGFDEEACTSLGDPWPRGWRYLLGCERDAGDADAEYYDGKRKAPQRRDSHNKSTGAKESNTVDRLRLDGCVTPIADK